MAASASLVERALFLVLACNALAAHGETLTKAQEKAYEIFDLAKKNVRAVEGRDSTLMTREKQQCEAAHREDKALLDYSGNDPKKIEALASAAVAQRSECWRATSAQDQVKHLLASARDVLRQVASDLHKCTLAGWEKAAAKADQCQAQKLAGVVRTLDADSNVPKGAAPDETRIASLIERAKGAQKEVATVKANVGDAYANGDVAAAVALASKIGTGQTRRAEELRQSAKEAFDKAFEANRAASEAQRASNVLVREALVLQTPCVLKDSKAVDAACLTERAAAQAVAADAEARLAANLALAAEADEAARYASLTADAADKNSHPRDRRAAVEFARLLDKYPDAKSLIGPESYKLSAGVAGKAASIKISADRVLPGKWAQQSFTLSTPTADKGNTRLYTFADGLARATTLTWSDYWVNALSNRHKAPGIDALYVWGYSLTAGQEPHSYFDTSDLSKAATSTNRNPWSVGLYSALFSPSDRSNVHFVKVNLQRSVKDMDAESRCSVPKSSAETAVTCVTGSFGPPKYGYSRLYSYEYRLQTPKFAMSPTVSFNDVSKVKELNVPVYLIHDASKEQPFTGGVDFRFTSKSRDPGSKSSTTVGVFVGAPFSLYSVDR